MGSVDCVCHVAMVNSVGTADNGKGFPGELWPG
jgi:hypothetical protein